MDPWSRKIDLKIGSVPNSPIPDLSGKFYIFAIPFWIQKFQSGIKKFIKKDQHFVISTSCVRSNEQLIINTNLWFNHRKTLSLGRQRFRFRALIRFLRFRHLRFRHFRFRIFFQFTFDLSWFEIYFSIGLFFKKKNTLYKITLYFFQDILLVEIRETRTE